MCIASSSCTSGGRLDGRLDKCYIYYTPTCSAGTYNSSLKMCTIRSSCPNGGRLDDRLDKCYLNYAPTCAYGNYDSTDKICYSALICNLGNYDSTDKNCKAVVTKNCGSYYTWNNTSKKCVNTPRCLKDTRYSLNSTIGYSSFLNECLSDTKHDCVGSYTYSPLPIEKCEVVPVCNTGVYDPNNNSCFNDKYKCPIDPSLPCLGTEKYNHWCSPWKCNQENKCGYAFCLNHSPSNTAPWMNRAMLNNIQNIENKTCINQKCGVVINQNISYCGAKDVCPKGFGVYEKNGKCYADQCPDGTRIGDGGNCYIDSCPEGTVVQGDGTCK